MDIYYYYMITLLLSLFIYIYLYNNKYVLKHQLCKCIIKMKCKYTFSFKGLQIIYNILYYFVKLN